MISICSTSLPLLPFLLLLLQLSLPQRSTSGSSTPLARSLLIQASGKNFLFRKKTRCLQILPCSSPLLSVASLLDLSVSYTFKLPHTEDVLGLPIGQHITVSADINGKNVVRSYTPISRQNARGRFELIIKALFSSSISLTPRNLIVIIKDLRKGQHFTSRRIPQDW